MSPAVAPVVLTPAAGPVDHLASLVADLSAACEQQVVLWRGPGLDGRDVDVLIDPRDLRHATRVLLGRGMVPADLGTPWGSWSVAHDDTLSPIDLMPTHRWPTRYQDVRGVLDRVVPQHPMATVAAEDLLLVLASDAVAGRDLDKLHRRAATVTAHDPGAWTRAAGVAAAEGMGTLLRALSGGAPARVDRSGRLPLLTAGRIGVRSRAGRRALRERLVDRRVRRLRAGLRRRATSHHPLLVTVSGMDGAGKTTLTATTRDRVRASGGDVRTSWARLGNRDEKCVLERAAVPVKRVLHRSGTIADPVVAGGPGVAKVRHARADTARRGPVAWTWIVLVALVAGCTQRRRARRVGADTVTICDRWSLDVLVDLELRYGPHPTAAFLVRRLLRRADLALMLEVDVDLAAARKPGDQARSTLVGMRSAYAVRARDLPAICLDASQPPADVAAQAGLLVDHLVALRSGGART